MRAHIWAGLALAIGTPMALAAQTPATPAQGVTGREAPDIALIGRGGAGTAIATGTGAIFSAPAMLGQDGGFQMILPITIAGRFQAGPVTPADFKAAGSQWSLAEREAWLTTLAGRPWASSGTAEIGSFGLQIGHLGLAVSHTVIADGYAPADALEAALFGNAGRTGSPRDLDLRGGAGTGAAYTTVRAAFGQTIKSFEAGTVSIGLAVDGRAIHGLASLPNTAGAITTAPLGANVQLRGRVVDPNGGVMVAKQLLLAPSIAFRGDRVRLVANVENIEAYTSALTGRVRRVRADVTLNETTRTASAGYATGDATDRAALEALLVANPRVRVGGAIRAHDRLWIAADYVSAANEIGQTRAAVSQAAIGAEAKVFGALQVRGGGTYTDGAMGYRAGAGFGLGPITIDVAYGRTPERGEELMAIGLRLGSRQGTLFATDR